MSAYIDLSVSPKSLDALDGILRMAERLGYSGIGVPSDLYDLLSERAEATKVRVFKRRYYEVRSPSDISRAVGAARPGELLVVKPIGIQAYRRAGKVRRVNALRLEPDSMARPDRSERNLFAERGGGVIEISLRPLLVGDKDYMAWFYDVVRRAFKVGIRVAFVSDAEDPFELWHPAQVAALMSSLGLPPELGVIGLTSAPSAAVSRLRAD